MKKKNLLAIGVISVATFAFFSFVFLKTFQKQNVFYRLGQEVSQEAENDKISYSLIVRDLTFPRASLEHRSKEKIAAASLIKLPILAVVFQAVEEGRLSLDQIVVIEKKDITGGSGKLKAAKLPYSLKLSQLLESMISLSDNTATNKVIELLGFDYINQTFRKMGLIETSLNRKMMDFSKRKQGVENYSSACDVALVLERIYDQKLISKKLSQAGLNFLKKQKVNDRLPRYLPEDIVVAHKTGLERGVVHDAGIVFTPQGDYIIAVLVEGEKNYRKAKKFIAQTSRLTYNLYDSIEK